MVRADEPLFEHDEPEPRRRPGRWLMGLLLGAALAVLVLLLVLRPWSDGGTEPVEAPGVAPSTPLPER
jgi:hypothetical protein